jgi:hypothetical protein
VPGRHSTGDDGAYLRSLIAWFVPWSVVALAVGAGIVFLVDWAGAPEVRPPPASHVRASPSPTASPAEVVIATPSPEPSPTPSPKQSSAEEDSSDAKLITEDVNVQVLNGSSDPGAAERMAQRLSGLGFRVDSIEDASTSYPETTVFWSYAEARRAGLALAERFDWAAEEKPENLSAEVAVHVVVGADEAR